MLRQSVAVLALVAAAVSAAGCGQAPATQLIVVVDTNFAIPAELDEIQIDITGPDGMRHSEHQSVRMADLPYTLAIVPAGTALGPVRVEATGLHAGAARVTLTARVTLLAQQTLTLPMFLLRVCDGSSCDTNPERTCGADGNCMSIDAQPLPWTGRPLRIGDDAGLHDAGSPDVGPHDASASDAGPGPDTSVDAGSMPDTGTMPDAAVDCRTTGCDDGEPCTDDVCGADGTCTHTNNTISCDDHSFCNGMDTCGGGTCSTHAGNPCLAGTCDETSGRCLGCTSDADCPAATMGAFGACSGFTSMCSTSGTHTRTVRTFHCASNACTPTDTTDSAACTRATDGTSCGSTSCGGYGACSGFSGTCGTSGTQSRTCMDMACSGGACGSTSRTEMQACSRSTDGTSCMATSCGGWSACGGFSGTCGNSGTQTRSCTDYACSGGSCSGGSPRTEMQACSRNTDGTSCMATSCGAFGACDPYADVCATSASQSRTCTDYACSGGSCAGTPRIDSQVCATRATDGIVCQNDPDNCQNIHCLGGTCSQGVSTCTGTRHCCFPGCYTTACP